MRILHILHQYLPDHIGGVERYVQALAQAQQQAGHEPALFCRRSGPGQRLEEATEADLTIYRAVNGPFTPARRFLATLGDRFLDRCLQEAMRQVRPDLIHIHHLMGLPVRALLDAPAPLVVTLHDYWWFCANAQLITGHDGAVCEGPRRDHLNCARCGLARAGLGRAWPLAPLPALAFARRAAILRRLWPRVAAWIAPTAFVAGWHIAHGLPAGRVEVIGHGIEPPPPDLEPHPTGGAVRFAYIGGLSWQKGVHTLIQAFNSLPATARLTIAGDEQAFPDYCARLRALAAHPGIRFVGRLTRDQVWRTLAQTDVLVVPSLWYETSSLATQEAFAAGAAVVAADHGALAERVRHGVDGLLFPPGDVAALRRALQRLIEEPGLLARLRANAPPPLDMAGHAAQIEALYRRAAYPAQKASTVRQEGGRPSA